MKHKELIFVIASFVVTSSCTNDIQIAENTFVHKNKIYKVIDNELREIGDLSASDIKRFEVFKPKQKDFGTSSLDFVKPGSRTTLKALYRGNYLYYSLKLQGINDLRENYSSGALTMEFVDEFGFIIHAIDIPTNELTAMVGDDGKPQSFIYHGKTEMSTEINSAIKSYDITSSIKKKSYFGY